MPQEDFSSKIGKSSSPIIERVIENNKNVQAPCPAPAQAVNDSFNKKPVKS